MQIPNPKTKCQILKSLPAKNEIILKGDPRIESYSHDAVMTGDPEAVVRPRDWKEVSEITAWCNAQKVPITVCGARTSMTGSSVATEGILLTTDHFNKIIDIDKKGDIPNIIVEPGIVAREFQKIVEENGFHYPVVPTSCDEAFIGGTVATNATGEDFYKYGPTRAFVREITFIKADGSEETYSRTPSPHSLSPMGRGLGKGLFSKGRGGYYLNGDDIDYLIGSEGTLGIFKNIKLELLPFIPKIFALLVPFETNFEAIQFIDHVNKKNLHPRSLELIDSFALSLIRTHQKPPHLHTDVQALVYLKDEDKTDINPRLDFWMNNISDFIKPKFADSTFVALTDKEKENFHSWRHHIPLTISEIHKEYEKSGGGKFSSDSWVPKDKMVEMAHWVYEESIKLKIPFTVYGHLGDGHPHITYICKDAKEKRLAKELIQSICKRAVSFKGGIAGEHGIGKIKKELLQLQYPQDVIDKMMLIKKSFDPNNILGRGNIF